MQVIKLSKVTSTQDFAEAISEMIDDDFVVVAEEQTKARGRYGREWYSPKGGLWVTYVIKGFDVAQIGMSTLRTALGIRRTLSKLVEAKIRWPNDVVVKDRKVSGVLLEAVTMGNKSTGFLGFGINTNVSSFPPGINATSIKNETGIEVENEKLLKEVISEINAYLSLDSESVISELNENLSIKERKVKLKGRDWERECVALFVDRFGRLVTECGIMEVEEVLRLETS